MSSPRDLRFLGVDRDPMMDHTEYRFLLNGYHLSLHRMGDEFMVAKETGACFKTLPEGAEDTLTEYLKRQLPRFGFHKKTGYV